MRLGYVGVPNPRAYLPPYACGTSTVTYAVFRSGGRQYCVGSNDVVAVEHLDVTTGDQVELRDVLLIENASGAPSVGTPTVPGAVVFAEVVNARVSDKVRVIKFHRRKNYRRTKGCRRYRTLLRITGFGGPDVASGPEQEATHGA